jgi:hypothetical protein
LDKYHWSKEDLSVFAFFVRPSHICECSEIITFRSYKTILLRMTALPQRYLQGNFTSGFVVAGFDPVKGIRSAGRLMGVWDWRLSPRYSGVPWLENESV